MTLLGITLTRTRIITIFGFVGTIITIISFFPQIYTTYHTKSVRGLSYNFLILSILSAICWSIYAYESNASYQLLANIIILISVVILCILYHDYMHRRYIYHQSRKKKDRMILHK